MRVQAEAGTSRGACKQMQALTGGSREQVLARDEYEQEWIEAGRVITGSGYKQRVGKGGEGGCK